MLGGAWLLCLFGAPPARLVHQRYIVDVWCTNGMFWCSIPLVHHKPHRGHSLFAKLNLGTPFDVFPTASETRRNRLALGPRSRYQKLIHDLDPTHTHTHTGGVQEGYSGAPKRGCLWHQNACHVCVRVCVCAQVCERQYRVYRHTHTYT